MSTVYQIARWAEVFETSESRKYKTLPWISERVNFDSTGWQAGLDHFGQADWLTIYGAWMVIVRTAATAKTRGRLCGYKGEPWTAARIARPSGVSAEVIGRAMSWAIQVGWLIPVESATSDTSGESSGDLPERRENLIATERNGTLRNSTERHGTERASPGPGRAGVGSASEESQPSFERLPEATQRQRSQEPSEPPAGLPDDRPASVPLAELAKSSQLLQKLEGIPVEPAPSSRRGSVFGHDRLKREDILHQPAEFWIAWYREQLAAPSPVFRCGNAAELLFVLAAVYAARRIPDGTLKNSRLSVWISWMKHRECKAITPADWTKAAQFLAAAGFGIRRIGDQTAPQLPSTPATKPDRAKPDPDIRKKLKARWGLQPAVGAD